MLTTNEGLRLPRIFDRNGSQFKRIMKFIENDIDNHSKRIGERFSAHKLYGGKNYDWCALGFPIGDFYVKLYAKYKAEGYPDPDETAQAMAGAYVGMCMKYICAKHPSKTFKIHREFRSIVYERVA